MATRPTLPYFAPADTVPAPLPTVAEIRASTNVLSPAGPNKTSKVVRVGRHFIVKYGPGVSLQEGENMLFVRQATNVRVPTVYALFREEATGDNFIVQEFIPGKSLACHWNSFNAASKEDVVAQLQRYFDELRRLPPPRPGFFCGVWEQDVLDFCLSNEECAHRVPRPLVFDSEERWVETMLIAASAQYMPRANRLPTLRRMYHAIFRNHGAVFTHADLSLDNIQVHTDGGVVLIDWEYSGWYPHYWEFCRLMAWIGYKEHDGDFGEWVHRFLDEHPAELGWYILFELWYSARF